MDDYFKKVKHCPILSECMKFHLSSPLLRVGPKPLLSSPPHPSIHLAIFAPDPPLPCSQTTTTAIPLPHVSLSQGEEEEEYVATVQRVCLLWRLGSEEKLQKQVTALHLLARVCVPS